MGMRRHARVEAQRQRLLARRADIQRQKAKDRAKRLGASVVKYDT